ncbi:antitoxin [Nocardiopsis alkaliphila]|uniref:antitoxin n=1 Tax=Nocardiopsis alkaliphila TaxID=225762 RepID=UPI000345B10C|nr:antitoxin [Nocardiopsis alkaliphila]
MSGRGESFDRLKKMAGEHSDKAGGLVDKAAEAAKKATGGKYDDKIDKGADAATDYLRKQGGGGDEGDGGGGRKKP